MMEEDVRGAGCRGRGHCTNDGIGGEGGFECVRFEPAIENLACRGGEDFKGLAHRWPHGLEGFSCLIESPEISQPRLREIGRAHGQQRFEDCRYPFEHRFVGRIGLRILATEFGNLPMAQRGIWSE